MSILPIQVAQNNLIGTAAHYNLKSSKNRKRIRVFLTMSYFYFTSFLYVVADYRLKFKEEV